MIDVAAQFLLALGGILLLGLLTDTLGRRTFLPRVTLLLLFGMAVGPQGLNLIPAIFAERFDIIADMALLMVGFLLGQNLTLARLRESGRQILWISISKVLLTVIIVTFGLVMFGVSLDVALLLGCAAAATDPVATVDVVNEHKDKGPFARLLLAIVAIDDIWGLMVFSVGIAVVAALNGSGQESPIAMIVHDLGGALLLGVLIGFPAAYLSGRIKPGQPMLTEALAMVFICGGLALWLEVSFLISAMVLGAVVANFARHHERSFNAIEGVEWPVMILFFVLAGASLEFVSLVDAGWVLAAYCVLRIIGKLVGSSVGASCGGADIATRRWMGVAVLPQAGVAMGMVLVAANMFPEHRQLLLSVIISSTVIFEIIGPVFTRIALRYATANQ